MRDFDTIGLKSCQLQANLFACSVEEAACSSPVFVRRFMNSSLARRIDAKGILAESSTVSDMLQEIEEEYGESAYGKVKYGHEEMYWMGYVYRYWCYTYQKTSKQIYKFIKPKELRNLYYPYHSLDPSQAIERILESKGADEKNFTTRGVAIMRNIMKRKLVNSPMAQKRL